MAFLLPCSISYGIILIISASHVISMPAPHIYTITFTWDFLPDNPQHSDSGESVRNVIHYNLAQALLTLRDIIPLSHKITPISVSRSSGSTHFIGHRQLKGLRDLTSVTKTNTTKHSENH